MKKKITSAEYQKLSIEDKSKYGRFCGSDEVYYELLPTFYINKDAKR